MADIQDKQIILKEQAIASGLKKYFTGNPCVNGHVCDRYISNDFCFECSREYHKKYKENNREKVAAMHRKWKQENKKKHCQLNKKSRLNNLEKSRERVMEYIKQNPHVMRVSGQNRRAREKNAVGKFGKKDIEVLLQKQKNKCAFCFCKIKTYHIDHITPLARGGTNLPENLQILCQLCNQTKHAKDPIEFAQENGRLL